MPWQKGQTGNPGGRPKHDDPIKKLAKEHAEAAIRGHIADMDHQDANIRIKARNAVLDRAYGKPSQAIEADVAMRTVVENWRERTQDQSTE